jgi:acyl-CoA hydrolase
MQRISIAEFARLIESGTSLFVPGSTAEPIGLLEGLDPALLPAGLTIVTGFVSGINRFERLWHPAGATLTGFFPPPAGQHPGFRLIPACYSVIDSHLARLAPDCALVSVAAPAADGTCALGLTVDFAPTVLRLARLRIAVVNRYLPDLPGAPRLPLDAFTHVIEAEASPLEVPDAAGDAVSRAIAEHVARLIGDGATLQTGIGKLPAQILAQLGGRRRLRMHTGIVPQGVRGLFEAGTMASEDPVVATSIGGDRSFYEWLPGRPGIRLEPVTYTHSPAILAGLERLVAVNSALEVDLLGQVNAEWLKGRQISGPGGLPDFAGAAHRNADGISVIALPASDPAGRHSRIVARLDAPPTLGRIGVDVVVTEHGIADLRGLTLEERVPRLIAIAAPAFREQLAAASLG